MRGPASENDYLSDDRMPGGAQASAVLHDNQQDVRLINTLTHHKHFPMYLYM